MLRPSILCKKLILFVFLCTLLFGGGCTTVSISKDDYDFIITDLNTVYYFRWNNNETPSSGITLVRSHERNEDRVAYWKNMFWKSGDYFFTKTSVGEGMKVYLARINPNNYSVKSVRHTSNDVYSCVADENFFYVTSVFPNEIIFEKYNLDLDLVLTKAIPSIKGITLPNQIVPVGNKLYVLIALFPDEKKHGYVENRLWQMDHDFNITSDVDLQFYEGGYTQMTTGKNVLYISQTTKGILPSGDAGPGNQILTYDLTSDSMISQILELDTNYPKDLVCEDSNNYLVVFHDFTRLHDYAWTFINLKNGQQSVLNSDVLGFDLNIQALPPYFTVYKGLCYILLDKQLVVYNLHDQTVDRVSLEEFNLNIAHNIMFKTIED